MFVASHLITLLACAPKPLATSKPHAAFSEEKTTVASRVTSKTITSTGVGRFKLGVNVDSPPFEGRHLWWDGYFANTDLRAFYSPTDQLSLFTSPKNNLYKVLVSAEYSTLRGAKIGMHATDLKQTYPNLMPSEQKMDTGFIYRPDHIKGESELAFNGPHAQSNRKTLSCALTTPTLPNVDFFFELCDNNGFPTDNSPIEAIMITHPDDSDMNHVDPILDLTAPLPCPKTRTVDPEGLAKKGTVEMNKGKMGEYHSMSAIWIGLPMLRDAALSGSLDAMGKYVSMLNTCVHQEYMGDPLNRPMVQGSQEALLFTLVYELRKGSRQGSCTEMLLNTSSPLTRQMFYSHAEKADIGGPCMNDYRFSILSPTEIEGVIRQAKAWQTCWD